MPAPDRDPAALLALADRLERAEGPSCALDILVAWHCEGMTKHPNPGMWRHPARGTIELPTYTESLDACRALHGRLLPGCPYALRNEMHVQDGLACDASVTSLGPRNPGLFWGRGRTLPLAWCAALCRALAAGDPA